MRQLFFFLSLLCYMPVYGESWRDYWIESSLMCKEKKFDDAEVLINEAIDTIERESINATFIYIERAKIKFSLNKNNEALEDINKALNLAIFTISSERNRNHLRINMLKKAV